ncbi:MAG TPA: hypothetical protein VIQ76_15940 [Propionibacteriaceae bacterium]|jgi:hypothetical protein
MYTESFNHDRQAAVRRTLALARLVAKRYGEVPTLGCAWLHGPHRLLLGATPAEAAWFSPRLARYASLLLAYDAALVHAPEGPPECDGSKAEHV